jgi:hypothetical protein
MYHSFDESLMGDTAISSLATVGRKVAISAEQKKVIKAYTKDGYTFSYDSAFIDSTGVFLIGELERLDPTLHMPLVEVSWGRDIDLREDVGLGDEVSSFTNSSFAATGGLTPGGISWISKDANAISGVSVDIGKTAQPLNIWGSEVKWTIPELESAMRAGRPVDAQKFEVMRLKYQMDIDQLVYIGDPLLGTPGLLTAGTSVVTNFAAVANTGTGPSTLWTTKTPEQILTDINELLTSVWAASAWKVMPDRLLISPAAFGYLVNTPMAIGGTGVAVSIMTWILQNNITVTRQGGNPLEIYPAKWCIGLASGGTQGVSDGHDRMVAYRKDYQYMRFPMTPLNRTPLEYRSLYQIVTYYSRIGQVEFVYPETLAYRTGYA